MKRILITGMSGTGKSTLVLRLAALGYRAIDTDWDPEWEMLVDSGVEGTSTREWIWREERIESLLSTEGSDVVFVSACVSNQSKYYPCFDHIILLSAAIPVTVERLATRTNNPYGKCPQEVAAVLQFKRDIEPKLRRSATVEIDTNRPLDQVLQEIVALAG